MGYATHYTLTFSGSRQDQDKFVVFLEESKKKEKDRTKNDFHFANGENLEIPVSWLYDFWTGDADSCKWYGNEKDMKVVSKAFPDIVFKLQGEGEEPGDMWIKYFKNGKMQKCHAKIEYDPYDESKLA
jgi:hypothetical protein